MRTRLLIAAGLCLIMPRPVSAQAARPTTRLSALAGRVRDELGHPLKAATVSVDGASLSTIVDDAGEFQLRGPIAGSTRFTVRRIGYEPLSFDIDMPADTTVFVDLHLRPAAVALPTVTTTGEHVTSDFLNTGFYDRQRGSGIGTFLTPADIAGKPFSYAAQYLMDVPGITVKKLARGTGYRITVYAGCYWTFVNGTFMDMPLDDAVNAADIYAMEVYAHESVPARFNGPMRETPCGAIVVWTKRFAPTP